MPGRIWGLYAVLGIKLGSAECKASVLTPAGLNYYNKYQHFKEILIII